MTTFTLPDLGEGLAEAEIVRWHVKVGDAIKVDQPLLAVETAKAVVEVPSPFSGKVQKLYGEPGDTIAVGAALVDFETAAGDKAARAHDAAAAAHTAPAAHGNAAPTAGHLASAPAARSAAAHDSGTVVGNMPTSDEELIESAVVGHGRDPSHANARSNSSARGRLRAAPAARAVAKRLGIDLTRVHGTGRGGIITVDDVVSVTSPSANVASLRTNTAQQRGISLVARAQTSTKFAASGGSAPVAPEKLRGLRRSMAQSMSLARDNVTSCTIFDDADLHNWAKDQDVTTRLLRGIAAGCKAEPGLNAWLDDTAHSRLLLEQVDVGIAVDSPEGLMAPVVRDIGNRSGPQLRQDINRLKHGARDRSLGAEDLKDFTFMLSNFGMIAGRYATPVVVPPAVAILGAGRLTHDVVAVMGRIEAHLRMPLSLTFDHRCVTGGEAARFMRALLVDLERET
ncbi:MAG TPA: dihydrolipoamide acetyltransferase family protein [Steroidobacteraceae bacterium]|jgi:pyruvate dehydrogenase E2 component (dihydrolipoamide acetyltransferase)